MWGPLAAALEDPTSRQPIPFFAPDLRGRGSSRRPAADVNSMSLLADDLAADISELLPAGEPFLLTGLSMGGYVLFEFLRRHASRFGERLAGLVLCDTRITADDDRARMLRGEAISAIRQHGIQAALDAMLPKLLARASKGGEAESATRSMILDTPPETACADLAGMAARADGFDALALFRSPLLLVVGEEDRVTPASDTEAMAEAASNAPYIRLLTVPDAGHLSPLEKPLVVAEAIQGLVARILESES